MDVSTWRFQDLTFASPHTTLKACSSLFGALALVRNRLYFLFMRSLNRIKHRRTEVVCTNCRAASKKCSDSRPCIRCKERGLQDSCADASCNRKKRKREDSQCHEPVQVEQQSHDEKSKVDALWGFPMRLRNVQGEWGQPGSSTQTVFATESTLPPQMNVSVGSAHQSDFAHGSQWMAQSSNGYMSGFSGPAQLQPEGHQWQGNLTSGPMFNAGLFNQPSSSRY
ncbi:hypothetical protein C8Q76DRAFT_795281 [Earliella scabrosa]|nr:hypothetical protein C8Q76DRAFT_795281 [Earliella scabrosa]